MHENTLAQLGVRADTLTEEEKAFLDQHGYLGLGKLLSDEQLEAIRQTLATLLAREGERAGAELMDSPYIRHPKEAGADRLADLVNKGATFDLFYTHPRVLAAVAHVLGPYLKLSSLNYRAAKPGMGLQKLHVDWHEVVAPHDFKVCNSIWLLDDFTRENGATRLVPGTHRSGELPQEILADPMQPHPDEVLIEAPAGSVFIFNSHTWHGGTTNQTAAARRAIHSYFCRGDQPQQIDQQRYIRPETLARLSPAAIQILGVQVVKE
ncbi:Ectoine hydroxylase-related dioxygenase, phytanoyl-CoA dioxygenase (PhyH) family [Catalinimonas alkaloidigena]|uniref:Ectoine hydroxylase-related dioxygenase, phytanoyl-CoA dioxygenase (PhyH) family n=1 Tax=Catalinimonas alkaloidigena TaxID=1075417 RepID=A0A1G9GBG6_9BACT|nr:phytanoyl-CoA dioxygenase family protein [Catalinimonas alkaloidigena]SDK98074.1 Ectoine hydroxylase-related dioxygenase, phytanoyl-CoA dioxygenase (PhyH) family [Catalinimonas alkaloidigena]